VYPQVISASRRTDVVMRYGGWLAQRVGAGYVDVPLPYGCGVRRVSLLPEDVHTMLLWSKDLSAFVEDRDGLRASLSRYDQLFCHLTVTGLGASALEPMIRPWRLVMDQVPALIDILGDPRRFSLRFDPIIHWVEGDQIRSNVNLAEAILSAACQAGVTAVRISFATLYAKVLRRRGWQWYDPPLEERLEITTRLVTLAGSLGMSLYACSQSELSSAGALPSRCVDGELLSTLHPRHLELSTQKDSSQRPACGCTVSTDIGSYAMSCPNGCCYCYANPKIH
jgi:hypothetical protein